MKKNYLIIPLLIVGLLSSAYAVDVRIQVDLNGASDFYTDGGVWIMMDNSSNEYYDMTDDDSDKIFEYTVSKDAGETVYYKFSYQTGPDPNNDYVVEEVPDDCASENGLRMIMVPDANETLPPVVYGSCFTAGITLRVDLSERTDYYDGGSVWVVMDDNWEEYYDMMSSGSSIFYYTLQKDEGYTLQYSFSYQTGPDPNNDYVWETVPAECANDNGYRELTVPAGDTVLPAFLYAKCEEATGIEVPQYKTTFRVDMRDPIIIDLYNDGGVWLNINNWTEWHDMLDDDGDNIYTFEMMVDSGSTILYKFSYQYGPDPDQDYMDEPVPEECTGTSSDWDREYTAAKDSILPAVLMGSCDEYGAAGTEKFDVTYNVELGGDSVITNGMWMVTKNPWSWRQQTKATGDVYTSTMKLYANQVIPYTYVYGGKDNWAGEESVPAECNFGTEDAPERHFEGTVADTIIPPIPFGQCLGGNPPVGVTYQVDMNEEDMADGDLVWLHIREGDLWPLMTDEDGDGIYTVTRNQIPGTIVEFHFSYGTETIWEDETVPDECANDEGWREHTVGSESQTAPSYIYGTCGITSIEEYGNAFAIYPNPANQFITVELTENLRDAQISIADLTGRTVVEQAVTNATRVTLNVRDFNSGLYILRITSGDNSWSRKILISE
jgi:hypothetical protein